MSALTSLRSATAQDIPACIDIRGRTRENAVSATRLAELGITAESWAGQVTRGELLGWTASAADGVVGYCFGDAATGEIVVLAVLPDAEGRGLGRQLLDATVADLQRRGHVRLFLGCSANPAVRSYGFYRHLGWRPTGRIDKLGDEELAIDIATRSPPAAAGVSV